MRLNLVKASAGATWVRNGIKTFARQPLALGGLFFLFIGVMSVLGIIPVVGGLASLVLLPAATVGILEATRFVEAGRFPMPKVLAISLTGDAGKRSAMLKLGGYYALAFLLSLAITMLIDGGEFARLYLVGGTLNEDTLRNSDIQAAAVVGTLLYIPLALLFWHAPALVYWHGVSPAKAMFFSLTACWKNLGAIVVFFMSWGAVFIGLALLVTLLSSVLGGGFLQAAVMPLAMVLAAMVTVSVLFSVRDSFADALPPLPH